MDFSCMHFYKHMSGFFKHSISLPDKLTRHLGHLVGKLLELKRPSGRTWYVGLIKSGDKLILQPGWNDFASDNNISQDDHLVFKFVGESIFEVFIFESAGCEKGHSLEKDGQDQDESLILILGEELPKEVHQLGMNKKDEQSEIQHKLETSCLKKKKSFTVEEQGGSEASNELIPLEALDKVLYQKRKLHKVKDKMKIQRSNVATKLPSKNIEENGPSCDLLQISEFHQIKSQKRKLSSMIQSERETPLMKWPRQLGMNKNDEQPAIQHKLKTSLLKKKKLSTDEEQGGSAATSESRPPQELHKILYQKRKLHKIKGEMKMQRPNFPTKLRSKKMQRPNVTTKRSSKNFEENEETSSDLLPTGELHPIKSQKTKLCSEFQSEMETPMRRSRQHSSKFSSTVGQEVKGLQSCYWSSVSWTAEQRGRGQQLASKVLAKNPYFLIILTKYNLAFPYHLVIPKKFSADQLQRNNLDFILYCPDQDKTWFVTSYFGSKTNQHFLRGPTLEKFVKENNLQQGGGGYGNSLTWTRK